jgi:hypothetical protein
LTAAVDEQVDRCAVDELEALLGNAFPVIGGDSFADDAAGDGYELQVKVFDAQLVDQSPHLFDVLGAAVGADEFFDVHFLRSQLLTLRARAALTPRTPKRDHLEPQFLAVKSLLDVRRPASRSEPSLFVAVAGRYAGIWKNQFATSTTTRPAASAR